MCGIVGFFGFNNNDLIREMSSKVKHRGTDDSGYFSDKNIELGFRRLSIIDLEKGNQPMSNEDGTIWIVYNGEIYNFKELRDGLIKKGHRFKTDSDTEVIIHAYEEYPDFISKLDGIFAFAIYDSTKKKVILGRDRIGVKPMYYFIENGTLFFASELKALLKAKNKKEIDQEQIGIYLRWGHFPGNKTVIKDIFKLPPGNFLVFSKINNDWNIGIKQYWDLNFCSSNDSKCNWEDLFDKKFLRTVKNQMISDVPIGIFLSGGLDSSAIAAFSSRSNPNTKTFSVGFECGDVENELVHARKVAEHLGTDHKEIIVKEQVPKHLKEIIYYLDEPVANLTSIPLYFMAKEARKHVKVVLSGTGGDEVLGGYKHYKIIKFGNNKVLKSFYPLASLVNRLTFGWLKRYTTFSKNYFKSCGNGKRLFEVVRMNNQTESKIPIQDIFNKKWDIVNKLTAVDLKYLLPENYLLIEDRMTMAHSLESRVPFLGNEMIGLSSIIPTNLKIRGNQGKYILRKVMKNYLPAEIIKRKKYGFTAPLREWWIDYFREDMKEMLPEIRKGKIFDYDETCKLLNKDKKSNDAINRLFPILVFQTWYNVVFSNG